MVKANSSYSDSSVSDMEGIDGIRVLPADERSASSEDEYTAMPNKRYVIPFKGAPKPKGSAPRSHTTSEASTFRSQPTEASTSRSQPTEASTSRSQASRSRTASKALTSQSRSRSSHQPGAASSHHSRSREDAKPSSSFKEKGKAKKKPLPSNQVLPTFDGISSRTDVKIRDHLQVMNTEGGWMCCSHHYSDRKLARVHASAHYVIGLCLSCGDWDPVHARLSERHRKSKNPKCRTYHLGRYDGRHWEEKATKKGPKIFPISDQIRDGGHPGRPILGTVLTLKVQCSNYLDEKGANTPIEPLPADLEKYAAFQQPTSTDPNSGPQPEREPQLQTTSAPTPTPASTSTSKPQPAPIPKPVNAPPADLGPRGCGLRRPPASAATNLEPSTPQPAGLPSITTSQVLLTA